MRKYLTTILTIVTISVTSICVYAENITDLQEKSNQINQSITETNNRLQAVQEQMSENMQQLQELDTQLAQSEEELNKINIEVSTLTTQISENEQKLSNAQEKYDKIKKVLDARVIEIYKSDNLQLLGVLFASKNVKEFFQTYDKLILLSKYDKTLLDSAEQQIEEIEVTKKILAEKKKQIVESKQLQQKKTQVVQNSKTKRQYYLSKLTKQEQELQAQIDEYNSQVTQIENEIKLLALGSIGEDYVGGTLVWPVPGRTSLTSLYGMRVHPITGAYKLHTGIDISAPLGTYFVAAANGVDFLEPRKPISPAEAQETALPFISVIVTIVLLKVDWIWAAPRSMFFFSRRLREPVVFLVAILICSSYYFFLFAMVFLGPLRVRALFFEV